MTENVTDVQDNFSEQPDKNKLTGHEIIAMYPTPLFKGKVSDLSICERIEVKLRKMRADGVGVEEHGNWVSHDYLHQDPEFAELSEFVLSETGMVMDFLTLKREAHYITNMWGNITNPNHRHPVHMHPNCLYSGILYIKTPEGCGKTAFTDPRPAARVFEPNYEQLTQWNTGLMGITPEKGTMMIWPSWMTHGVDRGFTKNEDDDRVVVAFNVMMVGKIQIPTASLELN